MGMEHKAYVFDWDAFEAELAPILFTALTSGECAALAAFITTHRAHLTDPNEGDPLPEAWQELVENRDAHQLGDLALTKYYRAGAADGLRYSWADLDDRATPEVAAALLGEPFGPEGNLFDPGKYGTYFQTPARVRASLAALAGLNDPDVARYRDILEAASRAGRGVYVTF